MNRIFICGDTHGGQADDMRKLGSSKFKEGKTLDSSDYVIVAGDFGLLFNNVPNNEEKYFTKFLSEKNFTTLFVDGNHENFDRIEKLETIDMFGGKVGVFVKDKIYHLKRGEVYTICGKKIFTFGGGTSIDKMYRMPGVSWWPQEEPSYFEYQNGLSKLDNNGWSVDYVITHDCPASIFDAFPFKKYDKPTQLQNFLEEVKNKLSFKKWYFGHYHDDIDIDDKFTLLYDKVKEVNYG